MPRTDNEIGVTTSVLDRLVDYEPDVSREGIASRSKNLRQLKEALRRDLEWLLNTRQVAGGLPPDLEEVNRSLFAYGIPDFTNLNVANTDDQKRITQDIEEALRIFEPRLESVNVSFQPSASGDGKIHFRIDANLKIEPAPEPITFDTTVQIGSGQYLVKEE